VTAPNQVWLPAGTPVLDRAAFAVLRGMQEPGQPDLVVEMTTVFLTDAGRRIGEIEMAIARSDAAEVHSEAHALKGGAWIIGAVRLGLACGALEAESAAGRLDNASIWVGRIAVEYEHFATAVRPLTPPRLLARDRAAAWPYLPPAGPSP
jgi:HPt (histidine-containing phosphotransfer) domain-containing protein